MLQNLCRTSSRLVFFNTRSFGASSLNHKSGLHNFQKSPSQLPVLSSSVGTRMAASDTKSKYSNRLAQEKSPYLLQHAHNPVDWYPWGEEAFQKAKEENKLIFLSIGYSTCHWCHVMEHESFANEEIAKIMNANFINIKVDREERPDIDRFYMNYMLMIKESGGWPLSVWLTPDMEPVTGGTYFPPESRGSYPGFPKVLLAIANEWKTNPERIIVTVRKIVDAMHKTIQQAAANKNMYKDTAEIKIEETINFLKMNFDEEYGGFNYHPKFPEASKLNLLFHAYIQTKDEAILNMATKTLKAIANGGIHDHIHGGFSRYAVDRKWKVPHFEKMLYDQAQLMNCFSNAYKITKDRMFLDCADGIFRYIMKDLKHPLGGFYSSEDADSFPAAGDELKIEGAFYVWKWPEIRDAITKNATKFSLPTETVFKVYCHHYDILMGGNVEESTDPQGHFVDKNILYVRKSVEETCKSFDLTEKQVTELLSEVNKILLEIRETRPRPSLDTKIITSWNALMLSGLSKLANCNTDKREEYLNAAQDLYLFTKNHLFDKKRNVLLRQRYGNGDGLEDVPSNPIDGFVVDYAFLIRALLDYYKASLDGDLLTWAKELQNIQDSLFWDEKDGGYFYSTEEVTDVLIRLKEDGDAAEPSGNSVSGRNLILLSYYFDHEEYRTRAAKLFEYFFSKPIMGLLLPEMLSGYLLQEYGLDLVAVVGPDSETTKQFVKICQSFYIPGMIIIHVDPNVPTTSSQRVQKKFKMVDDKPTVYICHDKVCRMPVTDPAKLEENLKESYLAKPRSQD